MDFKKIRGLVFEEYKKNGYVDMWGFPNYEQQQRHKALASCYIVLKELTDYMERVRSGEPINTDAFFNKFPNWTMAKVSSTAEAILITTEVVELAESLLVGDMENGGEEMADIFIRLSNLATRLGVDLEEEVFKKHEKNWKRKTLHGRKI